MLRKLPGTEKLLVRVSPCCSMGYRTGLKGDRDQQLPAPPSHAGPGPRQGGPCSWPVPPASRAQLPLLRERSFSVREGAQQVCPGWVTVSSADQQEEKREKMEKKEEREGRAYTKASKCAPPAVAQLVEHHLLHPTARAPKEGKCSIFSLSLSSGGDLK